MQAITQARGTHRALVSVVIMFFFFAFREKKIIEKSEFLLSARSAVNSDAMVMG